MGDNTKKAEEEIAYFKKKIKDLEKALEKNIKVTNSIFKKINDSLDKIPEK